MATNNYYENIALYSLVMV